MPEAQQLVPEEVEIAFLKRFDMARLVLERKYRWARLTLRNLTPVRIAEGTFSVDQYLRVAHGPVADTWTDKEFLGALWHETNHVLRHHHERFDGVGERFKLPRKLVNLATDLEINDDMRSQSITLPQDVFYSDMVGHLSDQSAEAHFMQFVEECKSMAQMPQPSSTPQAGDDEGDEQEGEGEGEGDADGEGQPSQQGSSGSNEAEGTQQGGDSGNGKAQNPADLPDPGCGAGSGNDDNTGLDEPDDDEQARAERTERRQAEEIVKEVEDKGGLSNGQGISNAVYQAAVEFLGKSETDWRSTMATEIRNAVEQRSDEAEEYTFRRRSRRADEGSGLILPGSYRPIPNLGVVVDVSGSMDRAKMEASMREVHGILERLAIPSFKAFPTNSGVVGEYTVSTHADIKRVFSDVGGGTDMEVGIARALARGCEVVVVLTDCQTTWHENGPHGIPVIIGGINRGASHVPIWARVVDVMVEGGRR